MRSFSEGTGMSRGSVDLALLVARVVAGLVFFMHGYQKLFDNGIPATQTAFDGMGAPMPDITAVIVAFLELIGGVALIAGALTRSFAVLLAIDMAAAFFIVHVENGFFAINGGFELVLLLAATATALTLAGAGAFSVDAMFGLRDRLPVSAQGRRVTRTFTTE